MKKTTIQHFLGRTNIDIDIRTIRKEGLNMEEIITINEQQYKLSFPQSLTPEQRSKAIERLKILYVPKGCIIMRESSTTQQMSLQQLLGNLMVLTSSCPGGTKQEGGTISLNAAPMGGIAPYTVMYYKKIGTTAPVQIGTTATGVSEATNSTTPSTTTQTYTILNDDVMNSTGDATPNPAASPYVSTALASGYLRIITKITDSCPTVSQSNIEFCDISLSCAAPTCNLIIT